MAPSTFRIPRQRPSERSRRRGAITAAVLGLAATATPMLAARVEATPVLATITTASKTVKTVPPKVGAACKASDEGTVKEGPVRLVCTKIAKKYVWSIALPPSSVPTTTAPSPFSTSFKEDFANLYGGWPASQTPSGTLAYDGERYRITALAPGKSLGVRTPATTPFANVVIELNARLLSKSGTISVGCFDTGPIDAPTRYDVAYGSDDKWAIVELRGTQRTVLASGELQLGMRQVGPNGNNVSVTCAGAPGGPGRIALALNGVKVSEKTVSAMLPAGNVSIWATPIDGTSAADVSLDNLVVRPAS